MTCICGGGFIPGRFLGEVNPEERADQILAFLKSAGSSTKLTIEAWVLERTGLAAQLGFVRLLEQGEIVAVGKNEKDEFLFRLASDEAESEANDAV